MAPADPFVSGAGGLERYRDNRGNTFFGGSVAAGAVGDIHGVDVCSYHLSISSQCRGSITSCSGRRVAFGNVIWSIADVG
ncbi:hypothetical protein AGR4B_pAt20101 [Agrobacterium tumefaciens str. CFBP 5621]|nr:hypothetical protein AGR4B_pAt20101 [Agrobacterium tumefaciens str. CFBP 5621]